jgi:hypothetical protein
MAGGVLRQVVNYDKSMLAAIAEILCHGEGCKRCDPLQAGRARGRRCDDNTALWSSISSNCVDDTPDARTFLADRNIDTDDVARFLIDDRVDCDRGLTDGTVADNELALTAAKSKQRIDDDKTGLDRLNHEIPVDDRRCGTLDRTGSV